MPTAMIIPMPRLSDSMEEGTIVTWLVADGVHVSVGQEMVEIETDKATMVYESEEAGSLTRLVREGDSVAVGAPIAQLASGVDDPGLSTGANAVTDAPVGALPGPEDTRTVSAVEPAEMPAVVRRTPASPLARRIAREHALDLGEITGSGPRGRVVRADVLKALEGLAPYPPGKTPEVPREARDDRSTLGDRLVPLSRVQQTIAARMLETKSGVPEFTASIDVAMDAAVRLRADLRREWSDRPVPSYNDMIVRAVALTLRGHPRVNATYGGDHVVEHGNVDVGVAVAAEGTLVVPVVTDADRRRLDDIATRTRELAARVRDGRITPAELQGGTFTISNLGMFGIDDFVAVLNGRQAAILAVGAVVQRPVVRDGELAVGHVCRLTLTADHRVLYGADAASFLSSLREHLESPLTLLS